MSADDLELVAVALSHAAEVYHAPGDDEVRPACPSGSRSSTRFIRTPLADVEGELRRCRYCYEGYTPPVADAKGRKSEWQEGRLSPAGRALFDMDPDDFDARS